MGGQDDEEEAPEVGSREGEGEEAPPLPLSDEGAAAVQLDRLLRLMAKYKASDLHLKVGNPPILRVHGKIRRLESEDLDHESIEDALLPYLDPRQRAAYEVGHDLDFAISIPRLGRFRLNAFRQRGSLSLAVRRVNTDVPGFEDLRLQAEAMRRIAGLREGLALLSGITGSGKSTTLAALIDHINSRRRCHIVTIEDPIEYLHRDRRAFVNQREIGIDVESFAAALRSVVRQDPDVILIGELRDATTFETALTASETGHLVLGSVHASSAPQTVGRVVDMFPAERERQVRAGLRANLKAIVCQKLLPGAKEELGRIPVQEVLFLNAAAQKLLGEGEDKKLELVIRGGREEGMQDFNQALLARVKEGLLTERVALEASPNPEQLQMHLKGIFLGDERGIVG